jgi:hypothetical protein
MNVLPVDLVGLVAVIMVFSIVLVPVIGLTARFALKPTVEALGKFFEIKGDEESIRILERRMALVEQQLEAIEGSVARLHETREFDRQLEAGPPGPERRD